MNTVETAQVLAADLQAQLEKLEAIGAFIAAAHLEASIAALRRQFDLAGDVSKTD